MNYLRNHSTKSTPQSEPIPGSKQVANNAGGFAFEVDDFTKLRRFLILGAEGGSYYATEQTMVKRNAAALERCLAADPLRAIEVIATVSDRGQARDNDTALFCLARASAWGAPDNRVDIETRRAAFAALPRVARTGTHILHFVAFMEQFRGWGPMARKGVGRWYSEMPADRLAYQMVKYRQRDGWSQRDVLRSAHPEATSTAHAEIYEFLTGNARRDSVKNVFKGPLPVGLDAADAIRKTAIGPEPRILEGFKCAQMAETPAASALLIRRYDLPREAVRSDHLSKPNVQEALLERMPMTALIRNLANMTRSGLLNPLSDATQKVVAQLGDGERIRKARVHPLTILVALRAYKDGRGHGTQWDPVPQIVDALNDAFYTAFDYVEPTGKRHLLAIDVSHSMGDSMYGGGTIAGLGGMMPKEAAAVMAMVTARTESRYEVVAFSGGTDMPREFAEGRWSAGKRRGPSSQYWDDQGFIPLPLSPRQRLDNVMDEINKRGHRNLTDCALPMIYAKEAEREVDVFVVYTDNETWAGEIHPIQALQDYRRASGINAKLVVCGMTASDFSIADPEDAGMLDVVGFDTAAPALISAFTRGEV